MHVYYFNEVEDPQNPAANHGPYARLVSDLLDTKPIHTGEWQAMKTGDSPAHATHELEDVSLVWERVPTELEFYPMIPYVDLEWASEHFRERVGGQPLNPAPSHERWPYAVRGNSMHTAGGKFDHTYPERFWPLSAGDRGRPRSGWNDPVSGVPVFTPADHEQMYGVRFRYGDLGDVIDLLARNPLTRQAYLPVWFPEDTGAHHGQRVPCTLGYHFMQRGGRLSMRYYLRSCDVYRHLSNDVFLAGALLNWVCNEVYGRTMHQEQVVRFRPGSLIMHISSLHGFVGDVSKIKKRVADL